jgi:hypothetical protein
MADHRHGSGSHVIEHGHGVAQVGLDAVQEVAHSNAVARWSQLTARQLAGGEQRAKR